MAKDFEQVEAETKTGGNVTLDAEAQQSREAGKQLAEEGSGNADILAAARSMEQAARKQKNLTIELRQTTKAVADTLKEIEDIRSSLHDITSQAQQAALNGVTAAQEQAQEETIKRLDEVSKKNIEYIDALTQESKRPHRAAEDGHAPGPPVQLREVDSPLPHPHHPVPHRVGYGDGIIKKQKRKTAIYQRKEIHDERE